MPENTRRSKYLTATILMAVVILAFSIIINATDSSAEKVDEVPIKCEPACIPIPPPPPPPPPLPLPPPPPSLPYCPPSPPPPSPSPPPPSPSPPPPSPPPSPKETYCPPSPQPPPTYIYLSPPGDLYPIDHDFGAAASVESFTVVKLVVLGVLGFMIL